MQWKLFLIVAAMVLAGNSHANLSADPAPAITAAMHQQWDQPDQKLEILALVHEGDTAIVDWLLGDRGGRALLRYYADKGQWQTFLCGGAGLTDARQLQQAGIPAKTAQTLAQALKQQEQSLNAHQKASVDSFPGMIKFTQEADEQHHAHEH